MSAAPQLRVELDGGESRTIPLGGSASPLAEVLAAHGLQLNTRCGQRGLCRGCEVILRDGSLLTEIGEVQAPAVVQACRARIQAGAQIQIPARSLMEHRPQVGETFEVSVPYAHQPIFAAQSGRRDTAFAVDVGTTTVVVLLVDLTTGQALSRAGGFNEQIRFGDNVLTRIEAALKPGMLEAMQRAVVEETIQPLLRRACERAGRSLERIAGGTIAGNTTMLHLLVGADPSPLGIAPFKPRFITGRRVTASEIMLDANGLAPETPVHLLPGIAAYIGADITAGVYASGMIYDDSPSLLVDMGTNGEIVLQNAGKLTACATAAGPAFEGCSLRCGTRARDGALSDLNLTLDPFLLQTTTIGNGPLANATGICGSAYVDFLASARSAGFLQANGRFDPQAWAHLPEARRFCDDDERALLLTECHGARPLCISEVDVSLLLQAKAAIGAGIDILLESAGLRVADLGRIYLAGGFGMHLNVPNAIAIGLLPACDASQVRVVGNTALAGAMLAVLDRSTLDAMESLREQVQVIELNLVDAFEDRYIDHLMLP